MSSPLVENFAVQTGTTTPATNGITPSGAPRLALIGGTTDHGIDSFSAPDASWTVIVDGIQWFWKLLTSAAAIATSQVIGNPNHIWVSLLTLFGSDGSVPVFTPSSVGNQTNPGTGNFKALANPLTFLGGETVLIMLNINESATGFGTHPDTFIPSDTNGLGSWTVIASPSNAGAQGNFAQLFLAIATNVARGTTQVQIQQDSSDTNPSGFNGITGVVSIVTHLKALGGLRLLTSLGVGI